MVEWAVAATEVLQGGFLWHGARIVGEEMLFVEPELPQDVELRLLVFIVAVRLADLGVPRRTHR